MRKHFTSWDKLYRNQSVETMPWYHPFLDPDLEKVLKQFEITSGKFLDIGSGPATQSISLHKKGFTVTGVDISLTAIDRSTSKQQGHQVYS